MEEAGACGQAKGVMETGDNRVTRWSDVKGKRELKVTPELSQRTCL